jgi:erythromycin esterase
MSQLTVEFSVVIFLLSCTGRQFEPLKPEAHLYRISGTVVASDGRPASRAIVIITNLPKVDEIALARTDSTGRFVLETSEATVSLAVATRREWAFVPNVMIGKQDLPVHLSNQCSVFRGQVELDDPLSVAIDILRIGGFDTQVRGLFGVDVAADYSFEACLPAGEYYITLPSGFAERTILTMVPPIGRLDVRAVTEKYATTLPTSPLDIAGAPQTTMVANLQHAVRILGLGESNHGSAEYTDERIDLSIALARQHRFSLIMIEAGYGEVLPLDDYIKGANIAVVEAIEGLGVWMWRTKSFLAAIEKLRVYNVGIPASDQISIMGIDIQRTKGAVAELMRHKNVLSPSDLNALQQLEDERGKKWLNFAPDDKTATRRRLEQFAATRDRDGPGSRTNRIALAARSILLRLDLLEQHGFWNSERARDKHMAQMAQEGLSLDPRLRATLWAHVGHLSREFVVGAATMGEHLAAWLGHGYQVWALLGVEGAIRARSTKHNGEIVDHILPVPPAYTVEAVLSRGADEAKLDISYWDLRHKRAHASDWLRGLRWLRGIGAVFPDQRPPLDLYDLTSLDGIVLFRHVSPTVPLVKSLPGSS